MKRILKTFVVFVGICCLQACNGDGVQKEEQPFVGTWTILEARKDGVASDQWIGLTIDFEQIDLDGGVYNVPGSPEKSIWKPNGTWHKADQPDSFLRDGPLNVVYSTADDKLSLSFLVATGSPPCVDTPCTLQAQGSWFFLLKRR